MVRELLHINFSPNSSRFYILVLKMCGLNCVRSIPSHAPHFKPRYPEMVGLQQMVQCYTCFSNCSLNIIQITFTPFLPLLYWLQVLTSLVMVLNLVLDFLWQGMPSGWRPRNEIRVINISSVALSVLQFRQGGLPCLASTMCRQPHISPISFLLLKWCTIWNKKEKELHYYIQTTDSTKVKAGEAWKQG